MESRKGKKRENCRKLFELLHSTRLCVLKTCLQRADILIFIRLCSQTVPPPITPRTLAASMRRTHRPAHQIPRYPNGPALVPEHLHRTKLRCWCLVKRVRPLAKPTIVWATLPRWLVNVDLAGLGPLGWGIASGWSLASRAGVGV